MKDIIPGCTVVCIDDTVHCEGCIKPSDLGIIWIKKGRKYVVTEVRAFTPFETTVPNAIGVKLEGINNDVAAEKAGYKPHFAIQRFKRIYPKQTDISDLEKICDYVSTASKPPQHINCRCTVGGTEQ